jgi:hypothetical protein
VWIEWAKLCGLEEFIKRWEKPPIPITFSTGAHSRGTSRPAQSSGGNSIATSDATKIAVTSRRTFGNGDYESSGAPGNNSSEGVSHGDDEEEEDGDEENGTCGGGKTTRASGVIPLAKLSGGSGKDYCEKAEREVVENVIISQIIRDGGAGEE